MANPIIPINDLARHAAVMADDLSACARRVLDSGHFVLGPEVAGFEREFAEYCGARHGIGVANGTDALELSLRALGVRSGSRVVVAANAAMYGTTAVMAVGAEPVFADVDARTGLMTPGHLERAVESAPVAPKAVIVTHLYGRMAAMPRLVEVARSHAMAVVEDCAQAHGATGPEGRKAGACGDIASFSFYPTKNLGAVGDGGAVVCSDDALAARVRQLRQYGWSAKYTNALPGGRNSRLDEMQAAFLRRLLPMLDGRNARRRDIAARYTQEIAHPGIQPPPMGGAEYVAHLYVVQSEQRGLLAAHLTHSGIGTDIHYPIPDHRQPLHGDRYAQVSLPVTESLCDRVLTLPCFPEMRDNEVDAVIAACNGWAA